MEQVLIRSLLPGETPLERADNFADLVLRRASEILEHEMIFLAFMQPQPGTTWGLVGESYTGESGESYTDESGESYTDVDRGHLLLA